VSVRPFGTLPDGSPVELYVIRVGVVELSAITLGAIITSLRVPDRDGHLADVVLGHDTLDPYLNNTPYLGALVGRYANRIARGHFRLGGVEHQLATNEGPHHLHGGRRGFDQHRWAARPIRTADAAGVTFERVSPAGEEQYPGTLRVAVTYLVTPEGAVTLHYEATTDAPTIVNLTQHTYFNLGGERSTHVLDHELTIAADAYTPVGPEFIPTGEIASVAGTPFDFRVPRAIGARTQLLDEQQPEAGGFDHNFVLVGRNGERRMRPGFEIRCRAAGWRWPPPNRACSSTQGTSWTARSPVPMAARSTATRGCASKPNTFLTLPISRCFRRSRSSPISSTRPRPCGDSPRGKDCGPRAVPRQN
jgi:aldose 1-epimerase